ncbi:DUF6911 family protein [Mitsuaria sp. 7]|uniref:DUF6911 family protein n=1 Tax=Mitsuaria sp. 7 TaxID=1658665 RepID=UPI0012F7B1FB|nr:hypothetical protein [Mitsuaria sp. 7]
MMDEDSRNDRKRSLELLWRAKDSNDPSAIAEFEPDWTAVEVAVSNTFHAGGFARLNIDPPDGGWLIVLAMDAAPGYCRLTLSTNDADRKFRFLEWANGTPDLEPVVLLDHPWKSQTICYEFDAALSAFRRVFDNPDLIFEDVSEFKSPWLP